MGFKFLWILSYHIEENFGGWKHLDLVNYLKFTKVSLAKIPFSIFNSIENIQIFQSLSPKLMCFVVNSPKFAATKVSVSMK